MIPSTLVIAPMFYQALPESAKWFLESAELHGIDVMQIGGKWHDYYRSNIVEVFNQTKDLKGYDYVLRVDAIDSLFATGLGEIHHRFKSLNAEFVISGERFCWPWHKYNEINPLRNLSRFCHVNAGGYMATWPAYLRIMQALIDQKDNGYQEKGMTIKNNDQAAFYRYWIENPTALTVDHQCKVFQCLGGLDGRWTLSYDMVWGKRPFNQVTKTTPCIFHANGGEKWRLRDLWDMLSR